MFFDDELSGGFLRILNEFTDLNDNDPDTNWRQ